MNCTDYRVGIGSDEQVSVPASLPLPGRISVRCDPGCLKTNHQLRVVFGKCLPRANGIAANNLDAAMAHIRSVR